MNKLTRISKIIPKLKQLVFYRSLRSRSIEIHPRAFVDKGTRLEGNNAIHGRCVILHCSIGKGTYIHDDTSMKYCQIGRYCSIASEVKVVVGKHPTKDFVSTHPAFYSKKRIGGLNYGNHTEFEEYDYTDESKKWYCEIGNDVWIGARTSILGGIKIGNGAIIAAGSVVTKDVPAYAVVAGVPAKVIRWRFTKEQIKELEQLEWWNQEEEWIRNHITLFNSVEAFVEELS